MANKIKCTCGHSWNKSDSSKKDMHICHICGKDNTMKNGGWLDKFDAPKAQVGTLITGTSDLISPVYDIFSKIRNLGTSDYSDKKDFDVAYSAAKKAGEEEFVWNGKRYNTKYAGTPRQEVGTYGVQGKPVDLTGLRSDPSRVNLYPMFGKYLPGHLEASIVDGDGYASINYSSAGNRPWLDVIKPEKGEKAYYVYGANKGKFSEKATSLPLGMYSYIYDGVDNRPSDWELFTNNCADNVCDAFGIPRSRGLQTPKGAIEKIKKAYPTLDVTGRTKDDYDKFIRESKQNSLTKERSKDVLLNADGLLNIYYSPDTPSSSKKDIGYALQRSLINQGYELPKSKTKWSELDTIVGDETLGAIKNWKSKNKKQDGGAVEGRMAGLTDKGFNFNPAWGGAWRDGGILQPPMAGANQTVPMAQTGTRQPIYTSDPRDPRLRSYQDSLNLYKTNVDASTIKELVNQGVYQRAKNNIEGQTIQPLEQYVPNIAEMNRLNSLGISYNQLQPAITKDNSKLYYKDKDGVIKDRRTGNVVVAPADVYKKPVQPVVYKKPNYWTEKDVDKSFWASFMKKHPGAIGVDPFHVDRDNYHLPIYPENKKEPKQKLVTRFQKFDDLDVNIPNIELTDVRPSIAQPAFKQASVDMSKPTKYSYTYPTFDQDVQKTMYFPDRSSWKTFVEQQRGASSQEGKDYGSATGQFAMGGSLPGSVGFTYAREAGAAPSEGPYAKKTLPSAQNGVEQQNLEQAADWYKQWYQQRQALPQFQTLAQKRLEGIESGLPQVVLKPMEELQKIGAAAQFEKARSVDPRLDKIYATDPSTVEAYQRKVEQERGMPLNYTPDLDVGISTPVLTHEMSHWFDARYPQSMFSTKGSEKYPTGDYFQFGKKSPLPKEEQKWISGRMMAGNTPLKTEVNAVLNNLRQAEGLKGDQPTTPEQMQKIIEKYRNLPKDKLAPQTKEGSINSIIRTLIESVGGDPAKLSELNNRIVAAQKEGTPMAQQGEVIDANKKFLKDWYSNRKITDPYIQGAFDLDRPAYMKNLQNMPDYTMVDSIDNNPNITGRYEADTNKLLITKGAPEHVKTHELNHYLNNSLGGGDYMRTIHGEIAKNELLPQSQMQGVYKDKYDYFSNPDEVHSRIMVLREKAGLKPNETVTPEKLKGFMKTYKGDVDNINDLLNMSKGEEGLLNMLNFMAKGKSSTPTTAQNGVMKGREFVEQWMASPMYKQMLEKSAQGEEYDIINQGRVSSFNKPTLVRTAQDLADTPTLGSKQLRVRTPINATSEELSQMQEALSYTIQNPKDKEARRRAQEIMQPKITGYDIKINPKLKPGTLEYESTLAHEIGHTTDDPYIEKLPSQMSTKELKNLYTKPYIPTADIEKMKGYNQGKVTTDYGKYVSAPQETRQYLNEIRYLGKAQGTYDPFTEKITPEQYRKIKPLSTSDPFETLREIYSDEQIIDMLNSISKTSQGGTPTAQNGAKVPMIEDAGSFNKEGVWIPDWEKMTAQAKKLGAKKVRTKHGSVIYFNDKWQVSSVDDNPDAKAQNGAEMKFYQEGLDWTPKNISRNGGWLDKFEEGGEIVKDDEGYWNSMNWGKPVEIGSNEITMEGVNEPLLGVSDTGDTQMMYPGKNYTFSGKKVVEYPREYFTARDGKSVNGQHSIAQRGTQVSSRSTGPRVLSPSIPTSADSLNVYNNATQLKSFYDKLRPYYESVQISPIHDFVKKDLSSGKTQKETLEHRSVTAANKQIIRANNNPNITYLSDYITGAIDPAAPLAIYDRRISPQGMIAYSPYSEVGGFLAGKYYNKGITVDEAIAVDLYISGGGSAQQKNLALKTIKKYGLNQAELNKRAKNAQMSNENLPGYVTNIPYYEPLAVKPYSIRTEKEKAEWEKKYGKKTFSVKKVLTPRAKKETPEVQTKKEQPPVQTTTPITTAKVPVKPVSQTTGPSEMFKNPKAELLVDNLGNYEWFRTDDDREDLKPIRRATREEIEYSKKQKQRNGGVSVNKADEYPLEKLDNLLNFTNYNKPKAKNGWLEKYK